MEQLSPEEREARRVREAEARQAALEQIYMGTGGIEDVLRSMRMYPQDAGIQAHGCMALLNLAYNNTDNEVKIVKAGGDPHDGLEVGLCQMCGDGRLNSDKG